MKTKIIRRARAKQDIIELALHIASDNLNAAERFVDAVEAAFDFLAENPKEGSSREFINSRLKGLRMWPIRNFERYLIFYRPAKDHIEIVRVFHSARDIPTLLRERKFSSP